MKVRRKRLSDVLHLGLVVAILWSRNVAATKATTRENCLRPSPIEPPDLSLLSKERTDRFQAIQRAIRHAWGGYVQAIQEEEHVRNQHHPPDDLNPISHRGENWLYYAATLHDSIDTLFLADLQREYQQAREWILRMDLQTTSSHFFKPTKTFEYSLRVLGGLLGAYSITGDLAFLHAAKRGADALLEGPFANSWTPLPRSYQVLAPPLQLGLGIHLSKLPSWLFGVLPRRIYAALYQFGRDSFTDEHKDNSLAGVGSFGLEFEFLSSMTKNDAYHQAQADIFHVLEKAYQDHGGFPILWNVQTGEPYGVGRRNHNRNNDNPNQKRGFTMSNAIGSGGDSFYEYLAKIPIFKECSIMNKETRSLEEQEGRVSRCTAQDEEMIFIYNEFVTQELVPNHVYRPSSHIENAAEDEIKGDHNVGNKDEDIAYPTDHNSFHHLLCFVPGMLALGVHRGISDRPIDDLKLAEEYIRGCYDTYHRSPTGLGPEVVHFHRESKFYRKPNRQNNKKLHGTDDIDPHSTYQVADRRYLLRPELVESLFVLYRVTKNPLYQEWAWEIFESIERHCKCSWGYAGVADVYHSQQQDNGSTPPLVDEMPSYFIAETLKYLLLIFGPDDFVSLDEFVFTTEAHPLWIPTQGIDHGRGKTGRNTLDLVACDDFSSGNEIFDPPVPIPWLVLSLLLTAVGVLILLGFGCVFVLYTLKNARRRNIRLRERKAV